MNRFLSIALAIVLAAALGSCVQMQVNNAQVFADRAASIAQSCPAAAEAAAGAQKAAQGAEAAAGDMAARTAEEEKYRAQADYWMQQAEMHAARAEREGQEAERLRAARDARLSQLDATERACRSARDPTCWSGALGGATERGAFGILCASGDIEACGCSDQRSCDARLAEAERARAAGTSDLDRQIVAAEEAARQSAALARNAEGEARKAAEAASGASGQASAASSNVATEERNAQNFLAAALEACEDAQEIGIQDTARTQYNQDIFGAQSIGVRAGCPVAMQASCAAIAGGCLVSCGPPGAPTSCSPGAPAGCLACFAAGCI